MAYALEGRMLEVCTCRAICPCWVGEDPDGGQCDGTIAWHVDQGTVDGVDVSGLTLVVAAHIPGNALAGRWRAVIFVDQRATPEQEQALLDVFSGKKGGPVADLAQLIGEVVAVERVPITFEVERGNGRLEVGKAVSARMRAFAGASGAATTLSDAAFSVIPGAPAFVGKADSYVVDTPALGVRVKLEGHSSVQGPFRFEG